MACLTSSTANIDVTDSEKEENYEWTRGQRKLRQTSSKFEDQHLIQKSQNYRNTSVKNMA